MRKNKTALASLTIAFAVAALFLGGTTTQAASPNISENTVKKLIGETASNIVAQAVTELKTKLTELKEEVAALKTNAVTRTELVTDLAALKEKLETVIATAITNAVNAHVTNTNAHPPAIAPSAPTVATPSTNRPTKIEGSVLPPCGPGLIHFSDGVFSTNYPTGMVNGNPFLVDNRSTNTVGLTVRRTDGPGSVSLDVTNNTAIVLYLIPAPYQAIWEALGSGRTNGCAFTVETTPSDQVVGRGVFAGWLQLTDRPRRW